MGISSKGGYIFQPAGNMFCSRNNKDIIFYEEGKKKHRVPIGEMVKCVSPSSDGQLTWVGTMDGRIFSCDTSRQVQSLVHMKGEEVEQIEEAHERKNLVVLTTTDNNMGASYLTVVSTVDWNKMRVFPNKQFISYFSIVGDIVVFGDEKKVKFAPIPAVVPKEATSDDGMSRALHTLKSLINWEKDETMNHEDSDLPRGLWSIGANKVDCF